MTIQECIRDGLIGAGFTTGAGNQPAQVAGRARQYFEEETDLHITQNLKYANDVVNGEAMGLFPDRPDDWVPVRFRMADLVSTSATTTKLIDDYKAILLDGNGVSYIPKGALFRGLGSIWICTNPKNLSASGRSAIVERCNCTWNYRDANGVIQHEPMRVENQRALANAQDVQTLSVAEKGYFNAKLRYCAATAKLNSNSRMILGTGAYRVVGFADFLQEFTGDASSVRLLEFSLQYEEPNLQIDDMVNHIAGGLAQLEAETEPEAPAEAPGVISVAFTGAIPARVGFMASVTLTAAVYDGSAVSEGIVTWSYSGAAQGAYEAVENGNSVLLQCWDGSIVPLTVTATFGEASASAEIQLEGM